MNRRRVVTGGALAAVILFLGAAIVLLRSVPPGPAETDVVVATLPEQAAPERADEQAGADSGYVDVDGGRLYFETAGAGVPVVLVHGNFGDRRHWDEQFHAFAREFRVIRYDLRGFGRSSLPSEGRPYSHHDDLAALLRALAVDAAHIVGISMGASIAADFAVTHPDNTLSLVSAGPWVSGYQSSSAEIESMWAAYAAVTQAFEAGGPRAAMDAWSASPFWLSATPDTTVREQLRRIGRDHRFWEFAHEDPATNVEPRTVTRIGSLAMPVLVITSEQDPMHEVADFLARGIPAAHRAVLPDAGHMMQMDQPAAFNRIVLEFMRRTVGSARGRR